MLSLLSCVLLLLLARSLEGIYTAEVGQNALLPCNYTASSHFSSVPVCWGRGPCPLSKCSQTVLSTDGSHVTYQKSSRYQLKGYVRKGDVSLTIEKVALEDNGIYCCRVEFPGLMNDEKWILQLVITPAKVATAWTPPRDLTTIIPGMSTGKGHGSETQTWELLHDSNTTQRSPLLYELPDAGVTARTAVYIGVGVSAGLALVYIFGALILNWYFHKKEELQNSRLLSLADLPPLELANAVGEGIRSEENIYTIEENMYELEDAKEYYSYVSSEQRP
ncbi:hepatitis A virus cellular receptor 2 [Echinops telfairi]|uniref:Hepatitis A virus cellular receptor 2 n=1 Tax=Echinops telfairi TaxID=9371 RepID=A0ABM0ICS8_ECHTE|nr:hepatitis A virus cellular receptor 2 [Echinops telfairi]